MPQPKKLDGIAIEGIDISQHQAQQDYPYGNLIDFEKVSKAGVRFCYIKASEGQTGEDRAFFAQAFAASKFAIHLGAYHFFRIRRDPVKQAQAFFERVQQARVRFAMPPMLDLEPLYRFKNGLKIDVDQVENLEIGYYASQSILLVREVERLFGVRPLVYSYPAFANEQKLGASLGAYPLWLAHYTRPHELKFPNGFKEVPLWQYTGSGKLAGVPTEIDKDRLYLNSFNAAYPVLSELFTQ